MKTAFLILAAIRMATVGWTAGTEEDELRNVRIETDFLTAEACSLDAEAPGAHVTCVGKILDVCKQTSDDKSRSQGMICAEYERDLWQLVYTRAFGQVVSQFASLEASQYFSTKTRRDEVHVFIENETLWRRSMTADCNFPALLNGSMTGGFESVICQSHKLAERAVYLRSLTLLGRR